MYTANVTVTQTTTVDGPPQVYPLAIAVTPNPSSGAVTFACEVDRAGEGTVAIFDLTGRRVAEVARGSFEAGRRVLHWDGSGADGERSGRGIYFVRMVVNRKEVARRFTLTR